MKILDRFLRPKPERLWMEFEALRNDQQVLHRKASRLAPLLVEAAKASADANSQILAADMQDRGTKVLFWETLIIDLHLLDRMAFNFLETDQRTQFIDYLLDCVSVCLRPSMPTLPHDVLDAYLTGHYNLRIAEYVSLDFTPPPSAHGGHDLAKGIGWRLAGLLGLGPGDGLLMQMYVSEQVVNLAEALQIKTLLVGDVGITT